MRHMNVQWAPAILPGKYGFLFELSCMQNADRLDSEIIYDRDFDYDYFGFKVRGCLGKKQIARQHSQGRRGALACTHMGQGHSSMMAEVTKVMLPRRSSYSCMVGRLDTWDSVGLTGVPGLACNCAVACRPWSGHTC